MKYEPERWLVYSEKDALNILVKFTGGIVGKHRSVSEEPRFRVTIPRTPTIPMILCQRIIMGHESSVGEMVHAVSTISNDQRRFDRNPSRVRKEIHSTENPIRTR